MQYLLLFILIFIAYLFSSYLRRFYLNYLLNCLKRSEYQKFKKYLKNFITSLLVEPFIIDLLGFNCAILENDRNKIETYLDMFESRNLKEHEMIEVYNKAFNYFIFVKDDLKVDKYYNLLKSKEFSLEEIDNIYQKYKDS